MSVRLGTEKRVFWILKGGLLLTPFLVFVVTRSLYFPFITGKNFTFRILTELLAVAWVYAFARYPSFRPKTSALFWAVVAFTFVMGIATAFALSPYKSFWSNFERMEGYVAILHLFLYFVLLIVVFQTERDWWLFFHTSLLASVGVAVYGIFQLFGWFEIHQGGSRVNATLGNATYLAAYLLFHLFFLIWFALRAGKGWLRAIYAAAFILEAVILYYTATRGAILGFLGGLLLMAFLMATAQRGTLRKAALITLGIVVLLPILFFSVKDTAFVRESDVLARFSAISPQETAARARLTIWGIAVKGWLERPILGWGQEAFLFVFSKHYEPTLWRHEPWFDRAHNVFLDWLTAGGILGLAAYLSMYATAVWLLVRAFRRGSTSAVTFGVITALLAAHFFETLFVFDNLTSYILFISVLAFVHTTATGAQPQSGRVRPLSMGAQAGLTVVAVGLFLFVLVFANVRPILAAKSILDAPKIGVSAPAAGRIDAVIATFRSGLQLNTFGTTEIREQVSHVAAALAGDPTIAVRDKQKYFEFAISELGAQRLARPHDVKVKVFLANLYTAAARPADALAIVNEALAISDRRPQFYFIAADAYLSMTQPDQAVGAIRKAYEIAPDYPEAQTNLAVVLIAAGREAEAEAFLKERFGTAFIGDQRYADAYTTRGNFEKAATVWEIIVASRPDDFRIHAALGVAYARSNRLEDGIRALTRAAELEPQFKPQADTIIADIRAGRIN